MRLIWTHSISCVVFRSYSGSRSRNTHPELRIKNVNTHKRRLRPQFYCGKLDSKKSIRGTETAYKRFICPSPPHKLLVYPTPSSNYSWLRIMSKYTAFRGLYINAKERNVHIWSSLIDNPEYSTDNKSTPDDQPITEDFSHIVAGE